MKRALLIGIAGVALALALAGGAALAGPLLTSQSSPASQAATATAEPGASRPGLAARRGAAGKLAGALVRETAQITGMQVKDVIQALGQGKSLAQIAQEHGKTGDDIVKAARTRLEDRLKQAVSSGRMTQARADAALAAFDKAAPTIVNDTNLGQQLARAGMRRRGGNGALIQATADVAGIQPQEVIQELRAGKSLAQIAQEHGKTGDDILARLREQGNQRLAQLLDRAKGLLDKPGLGGNQPVPQA